MRNLDLSNVFVLSVVTIQLLIARSLSFWVTEVKLLIIRKSRPKNFLKKKKVHVLCYDYYVSSLLTKFFNLCSEM